MRHLLPHPDTPDHSSEDGARRLAARIANFWSERGFEPPACRVEHCGLPVVCAPAFYGVRSDLGARGGLPIRKPRMTGAFQMVVSRGPK